MPKVESFYSPCSSEDCTTVKNQVLGSYDRKAHKKKPLAHMKGGLGTTILEPARVPIMGEAKEYTVKEHGLGIQFKRCYEFDYIDKYRHKPVSDTCTKKLVVNIPQRTMNCYRDVSDLLTQMKKGKKGRPGINHKVIALVACSKSGTAPTRVSEPMSPAIVASVLGESQYKVRKTMEELVKTGKLATDKPLDVVNEKQVRLPPKYQKAFDDFIKGEKAERRLAGMRMVFGTGFVPASISPNLPEAEAFAVPVRGFKPKKLGKKAMKRFMREAEEWKLTTGIVRSGTFVKKPSKIKKLHKKETERVELEQLLGTHL